MNKQTRSIGVNTDINFQNNKCTCCQDSCGKYNFIPCFLPFPYPICNCAMFPCFQKNIMDISQCNSHFCLQNCLSNSTCKNCSNKNSTNSEEKIDISQSSSKEFSDPNIKECNIEDPKISKFADEYLETNRQYKERSRYEEINPTINHLLKPTPQENEDSEDCSESDNEDLTEDSVSGKTVVHISPKDMNDRVPTRINLPSQRSSNKNSEAEMLMMIKALVNNQYSNSSPHLNKLLNHIGSEDPGKRQQSRTHLQQK